MLQEMDTITPLGVDEMAECCTGGSRLSHTAVKPDSCLAWIFVAKSLCIIKPIIIIG